MGILTFLLSLAWAQNQFVIWNVGQGQWLTSVEEKICIHFDMGGEIFPQTVSLHCAGKQNIIYLSHWDWDHIGLIQKFKKLRLQTCLALLPLGPAKASKQKLIKSLPECKKIEFSNVHKMNQLFFKRPTSNALSHVLIHKASQILIPGDSTTTQEKSWARKVPKNTHGLILGHHGSRTSTSQFLLAQLPRLKWAVSSARKDRYGHPHVEVLNRLAKRKIPILQTEEWGNIHFQY